MDPENTNIQNLDPSQLEQPIQDVTQKKLKLAGRPGMPLMTNIPGKKHVAILSLEQGAILLEKWEMNNYCDFAAWLSIAGAQATFHVEEKISFNAKPSKNKTVQIKSFQCHIQLEFKDKSIDGLIGKQSVQ